MVLVAAKIALTALCIGFGFAGGVFSPALLIGVLFGALFWTLMDSSQFVLNSGVVVYAICGMMAVASPVIGAPLTVILIVFELTRNYDLTIAAMVAVVFSNLVSFRMFGRSLFDIQLAGQGIDLSVGRDRARLEDIRVANYLTENFPLGIGTETADTVFARIDESKWNEAFICDRNRIFLGKLAPKEGREHHNVLASDILVPVKQTFDEQTSVFTAMETLGDFVGDAVPVVSARNGELIGVVTEAAIIMAYLELVHDHRREENAFN